MFNTRNTAWDTLGANRSQYQASRLVSSQAVGREGVLPMWMMIENVLITQERWAISELSDSFCAKKN